MRVFRKAVTIRPSTGGCLLNDPRKTKDAEDRFALPPHLQDRAKRWFTEAREQTKRDDAEIAAWRSDTRSSGDGGSGGFDWGGGDGGGDGGGGGD